MNDRCATVRSDYQFGVVYGHFAWYDYVYGEPVCAIFSVCKVYKKQIVYVSTDVCECFLLSLAVMFKVPLSMYDHCCYNMCMCFRLRQVR